MDLYGRSLVKEVDFSKEELSYLLDLAAELRSESRSGDEVQRLVGKNIALIFEKSSTRTRCGFEVAAHHQGAHVTHLGPGETHLGRKESAKDVARVLGRMYDGIGYRGFAQETVEILAEHAGVPVWNGLTDEWHPTQMLADFLTIRDHSPKPVEEVTLCYLGDAANNTARSLYVTGALLGCDIRLGAPGALWPAAEVQELAGRLAATSGARLLLTDDVEQAVAGADFVYTDVWLSMGEPESLWTDRVRDLLAYQVNAEVMKATGNPHVKLLHCLPALHDRETEVGEELHERFGTDALEVTDEVFESEASVVFDQAENRLHTIKAVMVATLGE
jgi:ornithine carbamoyltransferase